MGHLLRGYPPRRQLLRYAAAALMLAESTNVAATTWTVLNAIEPPTAGSTLCVTTNCQTLRDAINVAQTGDTIRFDPALDGATITLNLYTNALGCITSSATTCADAQQSLSIEFGPTAFFISGNKTLIIDALNGLTHGITLERSDAVEAFRLFQVGPGSTLILAGLALRGGLTRAGNSTVGGGALGAGGAIFNQGTLNLSRCAFIGNRAQGGGYQPGFSVSGGGAGADAGWENGDYVGAGPNGGSSLAPGAFGGGGGAAGPGGFGGGGGAAQPAISAAVGGFGGGGGGSANGEPESAGGFGGGTGSAVSLASGGGGAGMGGAIFNDNGLITANNLTFYDNAAIGGMGYLAGGGSAYGGALFNYAGYVAITNSTFSHNRVEGGAGAPAGAADGGAVYSKFDSLANCSAGGNPCNLNPSPGVYPSLFFSASITAHSIGAAHDLVSVITNVDDQNFTTLGNSLIGSFQISGNASDGTLGGGADPQLGTPGRYGDSLVVVPIAANSPARDAIACSGLVPYDGRKLARPQGASCDIGAYEYAQPVDDYVFSNGVD